MSKLEKFTYRSPSEATTMYREFSLQQKEEMTTVYQNAFGGEPWYERFACPSCGAFSSGNSCIQCTRTNLPEAYPKDDLIEQYFPDMLSSFTPGTLLLSYDENNAVNGFSTGGFTSLELLVDTKYEGNETILYSITQQQALTPETVIFYDNETCIDSTRQRGGIGRSFSQQRIKTAAELNASVICGRTINLSWLHLKEKQLSEAGYEVKATIPEGDSYSVNGVRRRFYVAKKSLQ